MTVIARIGIFTKPLVAYRMEPVLDGLKTAMAARPLKHTGSWQSQKNPQAAKTRELEDVIVDFNIPETVDELADMIKPNLPWAEDHFLERVCGNPLNPPPSQEYWPFQRNDNREHRNESGMFSHTYPERFWPKYAGEGERFAQHRGIRFAYGDLDDVVNLMKREPGTRQAYLPIFFPEDTGAKEGQRIPCSLGYQFILRDSGLSVKYFLRSCDLIRHFQDDMYMAARLGQWVAGRLGVSPGTMTAFITSLHTFSADGPHIKRVAKQYHQSETSRGVSRSIDDWLVDIDVSNFSQ